MNLKGLNENQLRAVKTEAKKVLVNAGAGSGKTQTISKRVAYLMYNRIGARNIYCITFTRYAAEEMKARIIREDKKNGAKVFVGTFHSFALNLLRKHGGYENTSILGELEKNKICVLMVKRFKLKSTNYFKSLIKNYNGKETGIEGTALNEYIQMLKSYNVVDVDLIIPLAIEMLRDNEILSQVKSEVDHLIVDEFQDSNDIQSALIDMIIDEDKHLFCVGDDSQAIYGWNNAKIEYILNFESKYNAEVINLDINYRSTNQIVKASNNLISHNKKQLKKHIVATKDGEDILVQEFNNKEQLDIKLIADILLVPNNANIAILVRTNAEIIYYGELLNRFNIQYTSSLKEPSNDRVINIIDSVINLENDMLIENLIEIPPEIKLKSIELRISHFEAICRFKSSKYTEKLQVLNKTIKNLDAIRAYDAITEHLGIGSDKVRLNIEKWVRTKLRLNESNSIEEYIYYQRTKETQELLRETDSRISILTYHASKGLEYDYVLLPNVDFPKRNEDIEESRRLFYVGITRAKEVLKIYVENDSINKKTKSQFIDEMNARATIN